MTKPLYRRNITTFHASAPIYVDVVNKSLVSTQAIWPFEASSAIVGGVAWEVGLTMERLGMACGIICSRE
jgi:hypothetical protein